MIFTNFYTLLKFYDAYQWFVFRDCKFDGKLMILGPGPLSWLRFSGGGVFPTGPHPTTHAPAAGWGGSWRSSRRRSPSCWRRWSPPQPSSRRRRWTGSSRPWSGRRRSAAAAPAWVRIQSLSPLKGFRPIRRNQHGDEIRPRQTLPSSFYYFPWGSSMRKSMLGSSINADL